MSLVQVSLGIGRHVQTIPLDNMRRILYLFWWVRVTAIAPHLTKISLLLMYMRVFDHVKW